MAKDTRIKKFTVRKTCSVEKVKDVIVLPMASTSEKSKVQNIYLDKRFFRG